MNPRCLEPNPTPGDLFPTRCGRERGHKGPHSTDLTVGTTSGQIRATDEWSEHDE